MAPLRIADHGHESRQPSICHKGCLFTELLDEDVRSGIYRYLLIRPELANYPTPTSQLTKSQLSEFHERAEIHKEAMRILYEENTFFFVCNGAETYIGDDTQRFIFHSPLTRHINVAGFRGIDFAKIAGFYRVQRWDVLVCNHLEPSVLASKAQYNQEFNQHDNDFARFCRALTYQYESSRSLIVSLNIHILPLDFLLPDPRFGGPEEHMERCLSPLGFLRGIKKIKFYNGRWKTHQRKIVGTRARAAAKSQPRTTLAAPAILTGPSQAPIFSPPTEYNQGRSSYASPLPPTGFLNDLKQVAMNSDYPKYVWFMLPPLGRYISNFEQYPPIAEEMFMGYAKRWNGELEYTKITPMWLADNKRRVESIKTFWYYVHHFGAWNPYRTKSHIHPLEAMASKASAMNDTWDENDVEAFEKLREEIILYLEAQYINIQEAHQVIATLVLAEKMRRSQLASEIGGDKNAGLSLERLKNVWFPLQDLERALLREQTKEVKAEIEKHEASYESYYMGTYRERNMRRLRSDLLKGVERDYWEDFEGAFKDMDKLVRNMQFANSKLHMFDYFEKEEGYTGKVGPVELEDTDSDVKVEELTEEDDKRIYESVWKIAKEAW